MAESLSGCQETQNDDVDESGSICSSIDASQQLVQKKNTTSSVWRYFGFEPDSTGQPQNCDSPKCKLCHSSITARWGNTSNLLSHLKKHHPEQYNSISTTGKSRSSKQPSSDSSSGGSQLTTTRIN